MLVKENQVAQGDRRFHLEALVKPDCLCCGHLLIRERDLHEGAFDTTITVKCTVYAVQLMTLDEGHMKTHTLK